MRGWHSDGMNAVKILDIKPLGPRSPFWECPLCKRLSLSCLAFPHADDCPVKNEGKATDIPDDGR